MDHSETDTLRSARKTWILLALALICALGVAVLWTRKEPPAASAQLDPAEGIVISGYYGSYDPTTKQPGEPAASLDGPRSEQWLWQDTKPGDRPVRLGVLFPNHENNDPYWRAVREGIFLQSRILGVDVAFCASDGYGAVQEHRQQFRALLDRGVQGILLGSIHYLTMDELIAEAASREPPVPVVEVINDIYSPEIAAKALVSFTQMGARAAESVLEHAAASHKRELVLAFFPGPINSGWAPDSLTGFLGVARNFPGDLKILQPSWGSPDASTQRALIETVLETHQHIDYLVGNAVAAREAIDLLEAMGRENEVMIVSTYYSDGIRDSIANGKIIAAPSDRTDLLGRLAVTMMYRLLGGESPGVDFPFRAGPSVPLVTAANIDELFPRSAKSGADGAGQAFARSGCSFDPAPSASSTKAAGDAGPTGDAGPAGDAGSASDAAPR